MNPKDIDNLIKKLNLQTSAELDSKINDQIDALAELQKSQPAAKPNIWRIIMTNKKFQLTTAVTVILMISLFLHFSDTSIVTKVYAISDMPDVLCSARNLHMKKIVRMSFGYSSGSSRRGATIRGGVNAGASGVGGKVSTSTVKVETEEWIDFADGRWRTPFLGSGSGGGMGSRGPETSQAQVSVAEKICAGGDFEMLVDHDRKTVLYTRVNEFRKRLKCHRYAKILLHEALGEPDWYDSYEIIGQEQIDGKTYDIWEAIREKQLRHNFKENNWLPPEAAEFAYEPARKKQVWLCPETGELARTIGWTQRNGQWQKGSEITLVEYNIDIPDEIFSLEPPPGYRPLNSKYSAEAPELIQGRGSTLSICVSSHIGFALPDGSVITCWGSFDERSRTSQDPLFKNLQMGGPLPKLPFEVYALEATHKGEEFSFEGYHLAYTQKNGEFYEWALYLPSQDIDTKYSEMLDYNFIFRNNTSREVDVNSLGSSVRAELTIDNQQDFETFVIGAMSVLSDNGTVPEHVTYQNVMDLAQDLKQTMQQ